MANMSREERAEIMGMLEKLNQAQPQEVITQVVPQETAEIGQPI